MRTDPRTLPPALACVLVLAACAPRPAPPRAPTRDAHVAVAWRYDFTVDAAHLDARVCFDGPTPARLVARDHSPRDLPRATTDDGAPLPVDGDGIDLRALAPNACVRYALPLDPPRVGGSLRGASVHGGVVAPTHRWLWFPDRYVDAPAVLARVQVAAPLHISLPWSPIGPQLWRLDPTAFTREGYLALSPRARIPLVIDDATLELTTFDELDAAAWLGDSARLAASLYGAFPVRRAQLVVLSREGAGSFGLTSSGGGASVVFLVGRAAPLTLAGDSTALHEFVHLGQPVMPDEDVWFAEGLAVYYELVLRARAGVTTPADAWSLLRQGFARGRADHTGHDLTADSAALRREHHYSRVYWTGAAVALLADVALRDASAGQRSLDDAVRAMRACCGDRRRVFPLAEVAARADPSGALAGLVQRYAPADDFPELGALFARLGLRVDGDRVSLVDAPAAALRDAIMASSASPSPSPSPPAPSAGTAPRTAPSPRRPRPPARRA